MIWRAPGKKHGHLVASVDLDAAAHRVRETWHWILAAGLFALIALPGPLVAGLEWVVAKEREDRAAKRAATQAQFEWVLMEPQGGGSAVATTFATLAECNRHALHAIDARIATIGTANWKPGTPTVECVPGKLIGEPRR